jgi:hypothetical protein
LSRQESRLIAWVALGSAAPGGVFSRSRGLSESALAVGRTTSLLWPEVERELARRGWGGRLLRLEETSWPKTLIARLVELRPAGVHFHYHPEFWPGRSPCFGDFTRIHLGLRRALPETRQWVSLYAAPPRRWWGKERFSGFDRIWLQQEQSRAAENDWIEVARARAGRGGRAFGPAVEVLTLLEARREEGIFEDAPASEKSAPVRAGLASPSFVAGPVSGTVSRPDPWSRAQSTPVEPGGGAPGGAIAAAPLPEEKASPALRGLAQKLLAAYLG